jgi:hypothetical protein
MQDSAPRFMTSEELIAQYLIPPAPPPSTLPARARPATGGMALEEAGLPELAATAAQVFSFSGKGLSVLDAVLDTDFQVRQPQAAREAQDSVPPASPPEGARIEARASATMGSEEEAEDHDGPYDAGDDSDLWDFSADLKKLRSAKELDNSRGRRRAKSWRRTLAEDSALADTSQCASPPFSTLVANDARKAAAAPSKLGRTALSPGADSEEEEDVVRPSFLVTGGAVEMQPDDAAAWLDMGDRRGFVHESATRYLRPYQREGVRWLYDRVRNLRGGV